jgi:hypothetical protein
LRWKLQSGDHFSYDIVQEMNVSGTGALAAEVESQSRQQLDVTWEVERGTDAGEATVRLKFDRIRTKMTLPIGGLEFDSDAKGPAVGMAAINAPLYQALVKSPIEFVVAPAGRVTGVKLPEEVQAALKRMPTSSAFGDLAKPETFQALFLPGFPILPPEESFSPGHQWPVKTTAELPGAGTLTVETNYHYEGRREVDGKTVAVIRPTRTVSFAGSGAWQRRIKEQSTEGEILFDQSAGRVQASTLKHTMSITVNAGAGEVEQKVEQLIQVKLAPSRE